jgi:hypothetical protein
VPPFDPIASPTVRIAPHREPAFVFPEQIEAARAKLDDVVGRLVRELEATGQLEHTLMVLSSDNGYYWLIDTFSALRVGEYKWMLSSTSDDPTDAHGAGGFTGVTQRYTYPRLFNLYLDPKETHSYFTRKLAYLEVLREGMRAHLATFQAYPPKRIMGLRASAPGPAQPPA